jgi:hypothetical protein
MASHDPLAGKMSEVTLYLPDELAEHVKEHDLPIYQICQRALQREVLRIRVRQSASSDLDAAVARLSQSKVERDEARFAEGHDVGMKWAHDRASVDELDKVTKLADDDNVMTGWAVCGPADVRLEGRHRRDHCGDPGCKPRDAVSRARR